jgi:hypothetical protein
MMASTSEPTPTIADAVSAMPDLAGLRRDALLERLGRSLGVFDGLGRLNNRGPLSGLSLARQWVTRHRPSRCTRKRENANGIFSFPIRAYCGRMSRFHRAPDDQAAPDSAKSPYAGLNYEYGQLPSTGDIGPLAKDIVSMTGVGPMVALSAAVLFDQGKAGAALDLLHMEAVRISAEREDAKARAGARQ